MPQTTCEQPLAILNAYLQMNAPAAKQALKDTQLWNYIDKHKSDASFPQELLRLMRNQHFQQEVQALQACIVEGYVIRTRGLCWQTADQKPRR